jgi:hypothetical protein
MYRKCALPLLILFVLEITLANAPTIEFSLLETIKWAISFVDEWIFPQILKATKVILNPLNLESDYCKLNGKNCLVNERNIYDLIAMFVIIYFFLFAVLDPLDRSTYGESAILGNIFGIDIWKFFHMNNKFVAFIYTVWLVGLGLKFGIILENVEGTPESNENFGMLYIDENGNNMMESTETCKNFIIYHFMPYYILYFIIFDLLFYFRFVTRPKLIAIAITLIGWGIGFGENLINLLETIILGKSFVTLMGNYAFIGALLLLGLTRALQRIYIIYLRSSYQISAEAIASARAEIYQEMMRQ